MSQLLSSFGPEDQPADVPGLGNSGDSRRAHAIPVTWTAPLTGGVVFPPQSHSERDTDTHAERILTGPVG